MKEKTDGLVNLYLTGNDLCSMRALLFDYLNGVEHPLFKLSKNTKRIKMWCKVIKYDKAEWIQNSTQASIQFFESYHGKIQAYNKNSYYGSMLKLNSLMRPI